MTLPKFIKRGDVSSQKDQAPAFKVPSPKHVDLLQERFLEKEESPETNPQETTDSVPPLKGGDEELEPK